ncbi:class I SAM-dependent methyltransferase [Francisellaceae bacterium]|nr:class I SAM-dependent methyltransferase [Francisellaceae bacterium]
MSKYNFQLTMNPNGPYFKILTKIAPNSCVLEFGPAHGVMTKHMKEQLNCAIYAVEYDEAAAKDAGQFCEQIIVDDIEKYNWKNQLECKKFNYIVFTDVLEHLYDPWKVLKEVKPFLEKNGY